jgi:hypothetical protein
VSENTRSRSPSGADPDQPEGGSPEPEERWCRDLAGLRLGGRGDPAGHLEKATISVTNTRLKSPRACRPRAFMRVARGWMNSVREVSSPDDTTETTGEIAARKPGANS